MKTRRLILFCIVSILLISSVGCNKIGEYEQEKDVYEKITEVVAELNKNSNLYLDLLTLVNETEYASYFDINQIRRGFHDPPMPNEFNIRGEGDAIQGIGGVRPFPWFSEDLCIIHISWSEKGVYHVFGIEVGDTLEIAKGILQGHGYVIDESRPQSDWNRERFGKRTTYTKEYVLISFFVAEDEQRIIRISVSVVDPFMPVMEGPS